SFSGRCVFWGYGEQCDEDVAHLRRLRSCRGKDVSNRYEDRPHLLVTGVIGEMTLIRAADYWNQCAPSRNCVLQGVSAMTIGGIRRTHLGVPPPVGGVHLTIDAGLFNYLSPY